MLIAPRPQIDGTSIYIASKIPSLEFASLLLEQIESNRRHLVPWFQITDLPPLQDVQDVFCYLLHLNLAMISQKTFTYFIFTKKEALIGMITADIYTDHASTLDIRFWLDKNHTRRSYMQQALHLLAEEFFFVGIERITAQTPVSAYKAKNLLQRSGYQFESIARHAYWDKTSKTYEDLAVFAKINPHRHGK